MRFSLAAVVAFAAVAFAHEEVAEGGDSTMTQYSTAYSTSYTTSLHTVTSCAADVPNCSVLPKDTAVLPTAEAPAPTDVTIPVEPTNLPIDECPPAVTVTVTVTAGATDCGLPPASNTVVPPSNAPGVPGTEAPWYPSGTGTAYPTVWPTGTAGTVAPPKPTTPLEIDNAAPVVRSSFAVGLLGVAAAFFL